MEHGVLLSLVLILSIAVLFLENKVFAGNTGVEIAPTAEDVAGFNIYIENYKRGLAIEKAAVENKY